MGQLHNELRRGKLSDALTRAVGASKGAPGIERFGETLTPVIDLWRITEPSWAWLRREALVARFATAAAVAGEFSAVALVNPVGSGLIVQVERAWAHGSIQTFAIGQFTAAGVTATLASGGPGVLRDRRNPAANFVGVITIFSGSDPGALTQTTEVHASASATERQDFDATCPCVIAPGHALVVQGQTVNLQVVAGFGWRERAALPGELD